MALDPMQALRRLLPSRCHEGIEKAFAGGKEAVSTLMVRAPNAQRGDVVKALWRAAVAPDALREAVDFGWNHDHDVMLQTFGRRLPALFRAAQFPVDHLPSTLTVWRGGRGTYPDVALGIAWTTRRDLAAWFAMNWFRQPPGVPPLVLRREIKRRDVLAHITARDEDEVVIWKAAPSIVDGDAADWQQAADRERARRK